MIIISFFIKASSFSAVITLIIFNNMFMSGIAPIIDAYTFDVIEERQCISYSNFRFMASAAWGITNLILGYVIKEYGINSSIILYEILAASGLLLLYRMKYAGRQSHQKVEFRDIKLIFKNKKLMLFFFTIFLMNSAFVGGVNYMNELVKYAGGDVSKLGIVWFVTCTFEVLTFFVTVRLISKFGVVNIYIFSIIVYGSKFILDFIVRNATFIIAIQVLEGVAFTLFIASTLEYLSIKTDAKVRATAMSTYAASGGLGAFSSSLAGGILLNKINPSQLYGILGVLCFAALIFVVVMEKTNNAYDGS
jgi:PPP family 3-phenylpropionic acid transporter